MHYHCKLLINMHLYDIFDENEKLDEIFTRKNIGIAICLTNGLVFDN